MLPAVSSSPLERKLSHLTWSRHDVGFIQSSYILQNCENNWLEDSVWKKMLRQSRGTLLLDSNTIQNLGSRGQQRLTVLDYSELKDFFLYPCFIQGELLRIPDCLLLFIFHKNALILPFCKRRREPQVWRGLLDLCSYKGSRTGHWWKSRIRDFTEKISGISTKSGEPCQSHELTRLPPLMAGGPGTLRM